MAIVDGRAGGIRHGGLGMPWRQYAAVYLTRIGEHTGRRRQAARIKRAAHLRPIVRDRVLAAPLQQDQESRRPEVFDGDALDTLGACPPLTVLEKAKLADLHARDAHRLAPCQQRSENRRKPPV
jgi:hypothetical protein